MRIQESAELLAVGCSKKYTYWKSHSTEDFAAPFSLAAALSCLYCSWVDSRHSFFTWALVYRRELDVKIAVIDTIHGFASFAKNFRRVMTQDLLRCKGTILVMAIKPMVVDIDGNITTQHKNNDVVSIFNTRVEPEGIILFHC